MLHTKSRTLMMVLAFCMAATLASCTPTARPQPTPTQEPSGQIANPASENCAKQGGTLVIQKRGDGGEYGVCMFEDNRQCEEWAMLRGECPVGGIKITGYITPAAKKKLEKGIPLKRLGKPEDIADAIVFMASDQARWITGQLLYVGGGWRMHQ